MWERGSAPPDPSRRFSDNPITDEVFEHDYEL